MRHMCHVPCHMRHMCHVPSVFAAHVQQAADKGGGVDQGAGGEMRGGVGGGVNAAQYTARKARGRPRQMMGACSGRARMQA
jgi:hypothetical protein